MTWERVICPACGKTVSVSPKSLEMRSHNTASHAYCSGSNHTVKDARIDVTEFADLITNARDALDTSPLFLARLEPIFVDLTEKYERDIAQAMDYGW